MSSISDTVLFVIGLIVSLTSIIVAIITFINQYVQFNKEQSEPKTKEGQLKATRIIIGLSILAIIGFIVIVVTAPQSSGTVFKARGAHLYDFVGDGLDNVNGLAWSPDSTRIASSDKYDGSIQVWDALNGEHMLSYQAPSTFVNSLSWSPDGKYLAANVKSHLYVLEVDVNIIRRIFVLDSPYLSPGYNVVAWSPDSSHIATACFDKDVCIWNVTQGVIKNQKPLIYRHHSASVYAIAWSPDGNYIASASIDNTIHIWDTSKDDKTFKIIKDNYLSTAYLYSNIVWSPNGSEIAMDDGTGRVSVWDFTSGVRIFSIKTYPTMFNQSILFPGGAVAWSPNSQYLAAGRFDDPSHAKIQVVEPTGIPLFTTSGISEPVNALAWSPDGNYIAAASFGGVSVWQAKGIDNKFLQFIQNANDNWSFARFAALYFVIPIGGITLYELLLKKRMLNLPQSKRNATVFIVSNLLLYSVIFIVGGAFIFYLINAFGVLNPIELGFLFGCWILGIYILPSVTRRFALPFLKRRNLYRIGRDYAKQGNLCLKQGQYQQAAQNYDRAIALMPNIASYYNNRGYIYIKLKEYQLAIEDFSRAIERNANKALYYYNRGNMYLRQGKCHEAIEDYSRIIDSDSYNAPAYYKRGIAYLWLKNIPNAKNDFIRSSELNRKNPEATWLLIWVGMGKQRPEKEIIEPLELIASIHHQHYIGYISRGVVLGLRGKVKEGLREVEKAISFEPDKWDAYFWKGMLATYYFQLKSQSGVAQAPIEQALTMGLPPILLTPLYWLEADRPDAYINFAKLQLLQYNV